MSIIEKAMIRSQVEAVRSPAPPPSPETPKVRPAPTVADGPAVELRKHLVLEQFPHVARDFRFLKRPVLARVFGLSRSASRSGNLVMLTSDLPQAGKSFVSLNLSASMASERMMRVVLIDADPVRHTLSTRLGVDSRPGLLDLLAGDFSHPSEVLLSTDVDSLYFMPAGRPRPDATELMASSRLSELLRLLEDPNMIVLLDSAPLLLSSEGRVLADHVDHALVVVEAGRSTSSEVGQVLDLMKGSQASVNLLLNKTPAPGAARHEEYYYPY
jgi:protein-tyrosine kinase